LLSAKAFRNWEPFNNLVVPVEAGTCVDSRLHGNDGERHGGGRVDSSSPRSDGSEDRESGGYVGLFHPTMPEEYN